MTAQEPQGLNPRRVRAQETRPATATTPSPSKSPRVAPRQGQPFPQGTIIGKVPRASANLESDHLTDAERAVVEAVGADRHNPPDLTKSVAAAGLTKQYLDAVAGQSHVSEDEKKAINPRRNVNMPAPIDIKTLPPEEQQELLGLVRRHKIQEEQAAQRSSMPPHLQTIPGMEEAWNVAHEPQIEITETPKTPSRDFRKRVETQAAPTSPAPKPEPEPDNDIPDMGAQPPPQVNCERCGHEIGKPAVVMSEFDKSAYLQEVILGGKRFRKEYLLFNGQVRIVFRELKPIEATHARMQAEQDMVNNQVTGILGMMERTTDYRCIMSIDSIQRGSGEVYEFEEGIELIREKGIGVLPNLLDYFNDEIYNTESFKNAVSIQFSRFNALLQSIEAKADRSDF